MTKDKHTCVEFILSSLPTFVFCFVCVTQKKKKDKVLLSFSFDFLIQFVIEIVFNNTQILKTKKQQEMSERSLFERTLLSEVKDVEPFAGKLICYQSEDLNLTPFPNRDSYAFVDNEPTKALSSQQIGYGLDRFSPEGTPCTVRYLTKTSIQQHKTFIRECTSNEKEKLKIDLGKKTWSTDLCSADLALRLYFPL